MLDWHRTGRGLSAVPVQQAQISVLPEVAAAVYQMETGAFHIGGTPAPKRDELETVWLFGGEAQLV